MQRDSFATFWLKAAAMVLALVTASIGPANAETALVGVASNFRDMMENLKADFERSSDHEVTITAGSTGKLYAQIMHGVPIDIFLAADRERPRLLEENNKTVAGSRFTYATGLLVLWSADGDLINPNANFSEIEKLLQSRKLRHLAIANPALAPYGAASLDVLDALKPEATTGPEIVMGENIGQTFALIASGNAELGFIALSSVGNTHSDEPCSRLPGSSWSVPPSLHQPIFQDGVLLKRAENNAAALAFLDYLKSDETAAIIAASGYDATSVP